MSLFPFSNGSAVDDRGRIADRGPGAELEKLRWLQFESGTFHSRGWQSPDGPGEWSWIQKPGDAYFERLSCVAPRQPARAGEPVVVEIGLDHRSYAAGAITRARGCR